MGGVVIVILAFATGFLLIFAANLVIVDMFQREQQEVKQRMQEEMRQLDRQRAREDLRMRKELSELAEEAYGETALGSQGFRDRLKALISQAGLQLSLQRLLMLSGASAGLAGLAGGVLTGSLVLGIVLALVGAAVPMLYIQFKRQQRLEMLRSQLPDCFDLMGRILRAGQTISQAMHAVSQEFKPPLATEFSYCYEQQNLGLSAEIALRDLARRTGLLEIKIFVLAMLVHRQTGGNLTELLDKLSDIVRDRYRLRGKIKSLTSEGRLQGVILMALPVGVYGMLLLINRPYAIKLFDHPWLPITTLAMMGLGAILIRKIVNFDF
jgi:tight adherence protein B